MADSRTQKAKLNIIVSLLSQAVTLICGFAIPRLMLDAFGSEVYGATASIAQFLAYITLLDGGIGAVARAALYKPLAQNDMRKVSVITDQVKRFFRIISYIFVIYVLVLACSFKSLSQTEVLDQVSSFLLVLVISLSTFAQYFIGISYSVLLQAAQQTYITTGISALTTVLNTFLVFILVNRNCDIIIVKLVSSCVFAIRPVFLRTYVKKNFSLEKNITSKENLLQQKWNALGQHIAYFLHSNTDIAVLTVFADLKTVAVYSVYNMVAAQIQNIATAFATGMEALFGDMLAKKETKQLHETFDYYETLISLTSITLFATTAALIIPFIRIYTTGVTDANYIEPIFGLILILSSVLYCLRLPYHALVTAAGHFKRTQFAAYGEAGINIVLSIVLVAKLGLVGVAIGTVIATAFRFGFYVIYLSNNIFEREVSKAIKRFLVNLSNFVLAFLIGRFVGGLFSAENYVQWAISAVAVGGSVTLITVAMNLVFYCNNTKSIIFWLLRKKALKTKIPECR